MGTWKLNESKFEDSGGAPKNTTVAYARNGDAVTITVDSIDAGKAAHHAGQVNSTGKAYAAKGSAMRLHESGRAHTYHTVLKDGRK